MYLENLVFDARDPRLDGLAWERLFDGERLSDSAEGFETRLSVPGGPVLDFCFQPVPDAAPLTQASRLRLRVDGRHSSAGPVDALLIASAEPERDAEFWSWLTRWTRVGGDVDTLRHPSRRGLALEFHPETTAKATKNALHLDIRLETGDDPEALATAIVEHGGAGFHPDWGELAWQLFTDPSGNEFCVLPARAT